MECKLTADTASAGSLRFLIHPKWNVNFDALVAVAEFVRFLIHPKWNVNSKDEMPSLPPEERF